MFHRIAYDYSRADWDDLCDNLRDVPWKDIFKLSASAAASEFCEWVHIGIDGFSSPWFSAACADAIVHRNHFFCLYIVCRRFESSPHLLKSPSLLFCIFSELPRLSPPVLARLFQ